MLSRFPEPAVLPEPYVIKDLIDGNPQVEYLAAEQVTKSARFDYRVDHSKRNLFQLSEMKDGLNDYGVDAEMKLPFVYGRTDADRVADYRSKLFEQRIKRVRLAVGPGLVAAGSGLARGDVITLDMENFLGNDGANTEWKFDEIRETSGAQGLLICYPYSDDVYSFTRRHRTAEPDIIAPDYTNSIPAEVDNVNLSSVREISETGEETIFIDADWDKPAVNFSEAEVYVRETAGHDTPAAVRRDR